MRNDFLDLSQLGLDGRDSRVYTALLKSGLSSIRKIADYTKINRGSVYDSIKKLVSAGLVNYQQGNVNRKYFAEDPSKIIDLIQVKRNELDETEEKTKHLIPELLKEAAYNPYANLKFYEDDEGVAVILNDVLETVSKLDKKEYRAISSKPMRQYIYRRFPGFTKQRIAKDIFVKVIAIGKGGDEVKTASRKYLSTDSKIQPSSYTLIYGNKVAIIGLNDNMNPYGLVIEDQGAANMQALLFDQIDSSIS